MSLQSSPSECESPSFLGALSSAEDEDLVESFLEWYAGLDAALLEADRLAWRCGPRAWSLWVMSWLQVCS